MKLTVERDILVEKLEQLQGIASARTTLPILNNVLVEAKSQELILTANNMEIALGVAIACKVEECGTTTIPCRKFYEVAREIPLGYTLDITVNEKDVTYIKYAGGSFRLRGLDCEEFPIPPLAVDLNYKIPGLALRNILERTMFAASLEEVRYYLNAVLLDFSKENLTVAATDARRLAIAQEDPVELTNDVEKLDKIILPLKTAKEIVKVFGVSRDILFKADEAMITLSDGESNLSARLVAGEQYPDYNKIIPKVHSYSIYVDREDLISATRRVSLLADPKDYSILIIFNEEEVNLEVETVDLGTADAVVSLSKRFDGNPTAFKFDARLLIDGLNSIQTDDVRIEFEKSEAIIGLHPDTEELDTYFNLIMPVRLNASDVDDDDDEELDDDEFDDELEEELEEVEE